MSNNATIRFALDLNCNDLADLVDRMNMIGTDIALPKSEHVSSTANIILFDETFRIDGQHPAWGLALTSGEITQVKNIGFVVGKKQQVSVKISRVREGVI